MAIVDPAERTKVMERVEKTIQDSAVMVQPFFVNKVTAASNKVHNFVMHPAEYFKMTDVWIG